MMKRAKCVLLAVLFAAPCSAVAQDLDSAVVVLGRVEDAGSREPVGGVRVRSADSTAVAITDSLGNFDLSLVASVPRVVYAERFGYLTQRFDLAPSERPSRYVLLLEPDPISIEGLTVEAEAAVEKLVRSLETRRNAYPKEMRALDRTWIERFGPLGGSALDLVRQAAPRFFECLGDASQLCVRSRFISFRNPYAEDQILVCIDGWRSWAPTSDLVALPTDAISLVEIYARSQVRVYTTLYLLAEARRGRVAIVPADLPIPSCG